MQKIYLTLLGILFSLTLCASALSAPPATHTPGASRLWNLQDADILSIINEVSLETGKNFVVDPRVTGKISLVSSKPLKPNEVYDVFLSILELLGYSAIPNGDVIKIVPNMESGELATRVASSQSPGKGAEIVVRIIALEHVSANQIIPVIRPLLPQWSNVSAYAPGNLLILLGRAANINRIISLVQQIDKTSDNSIEIVPLHQASASQMATVLSNLQNAGRSSGETPQLSIAPDERSNSILLSGNRAARLHMRYLISQLDTPVSGTQGNTEVVYLKYLQAKEFAPISGKIAQNIAGKDGEDKNATSPVSLPSSTAINSASAKKTAPENLTNIQAESATNALIVTAPPALMKSLNNVIAKLDIRPAQVLIEGIIVELDEGDLKNMGVQWGSLVNGDTINTTSGAITDFPSMGAGNIGIIPHQQIRAVLSLLENKTGVNVLSTPSVVVLDNQKATLEVGKDVPRETGSYATTGSTSTAQPFNTFDYKKVALTLKVTPQINLGNAVRLKISITNDTLQNPENPGNTPLINTSKIDNSVIINSDDILVLGGLISNNITENTNKVPFFRGHSDSRQSLPTKRTQIGKEKFDGIFKKPVILHNGDDATEITDTKYNNIRQAQINWPSNLSREGDQKLQNILQPWKDNTVLPKPFEE